MKRKLLSILALSILIVTSAVAGGGRPTAAGHWEGTGRAMYMDGTSADITLVIADLSQEGKFIYGTAQFTVIIGDNDPDTQVGQMSGHIQGNSIEGVLGGCVTTAPDCAGAAVFDGKLTGNKLKGTVVDLSDGSTSTLTLHRMSH
jgi:hypothetical protein